MATGKETEGYFRDRNKRVDELTEANDRQVAGDHYRKDNPEFQHWDLIAANHVGYFEGQVTKYISRWNRKGGKQDLEKAGHYLQKLIELIIAGVLPLPEPREAKRLDEYRTTHEMDIYEYHVFRTMLTYTSLDDLLPLQDTLETLKH